MKEIEIDTLRDFAIANFPRAQAIQQRAAKFLSEADYYRSLAFVATMERSKPSITAIEKTAADILETVCLLRAQRDEKLSKATCAELYGRLTSDALQLCSLTGREIAWLDAMPPQPEPEPEEENEEEDESRVAPTKFPPPLQIRGKLLSTKDAADALGYKPQTLRNWASKQNGLIQPIREEGRDLRWSGDEIADLQERKSRRQ